MINEITKTEYDQFIDYCAMFYSEGQMYAQREFATKAQIREATNIYLMRGDEQFFINGEHRWGGGDTIDREIVAGVLIEELGIDLY